MLMPVPPARLYAPPSSPAGGNRLAIHVSLLVLYAWGGWLVSHGQLPVGVLVTGIGFTFSLTFAIQVCARLTWWMAAVLWLSQHALLSPLLSWNAA